MIKRTLEISREAAHLAVRNNQLTVSKNREVCGSIPCEDLGMVVVDHPQVTWTQSALSALLESAAVIVMCGKNHLPLGILLPIADHTQVVWRIHDQIAAPKPLCKRIWTQLVQAKIRAQARNLTPKSASTRKLEQFASEVKSGDTTNREGLAARVYWSAWLLEFTDPEISDPASHEPLRFRRQTDGDGINALLNYGYAIFRAALARAIVAAGLHPALGIHHSNRGNPFCLADDLIEPLRPIVDRTVRRLFFNGSFELDQPTKASLLELLAEEVRLNEETGPLMVNLHRYVTSFVKCLQKQRNTLEIPELIWKST